MQLDGHHRIFRCNHFQLIQLFYPLGDNQIIGQVCIQLLVLFYFLCERIGGRCQVFVNSF